MLRKDVCKILTENKNSIVYIASSNKNLEIYFDKMWEEKSIKLIKISDIQEESEYFKINYELLEALKSDLKVVILVSVEGILSQYSLNEDMITLNLGSNVVRKDLIDILEKNNFKKKYLVEDRMEYSVRGDIIDVFPPNGEYPIRVEFFGNEIDRITNFSCTDQKSFEKLSIVNMYINKNKKNLLNFLEIIARFKKNREVDIYLENEEIVSYKIEESIIRDRDNENSYKNIYNSLEKESIKLNVIKSEGDNQRQKPKFSKGGIKYENTSQIREGDYIIHENYGVGLYLGIEEINGKDYLAIKYADEDKLFVPIEGLNKIERFLVDPGNIPELYNLGRRGFKKRREKLEEDMLKFAEEIVKIQAKRALNMGFKFSPDTVWQEEFEEKFPYIETRDQKRAIEDVKRDMESSKVMDRIVCGDVGYGKTEVALRAAFKAIMDGKQVLFIAPTTVLAQQHYERFLERYKDYPITVELLSRLSNEKDQKEIIKKMLSGSIDIIIGTHRLLSEDVKLKDLGLVIIDEEQKFGVKAKEKLKKMRTNVDMLTLTATPIPRTLNYALLGIRDISVIETAPEGRVPVETTFINDDKKEIREVIMKEIAREGQVFYIFNRVKRMEDKLNELKKALPKFVSIEYIHGKMSPKNIKEKLKSFEDGDIDILLSTTIIENGIDIENANTILIEGIDKLGLSQVYQLRGRVGRGKRKGYCYLVIDKDKKTGKKATQRKETLKEIGELGGGFKLSLEDMRIRGAGEILGEKQHGALETFGYNLYTKLLQEEIAKVRGEEEESSEIKIYLEEDSYLPKDYIEGDERLVVYRRLVDIKKIEDLKEIELEMKDRFGDLPKEAKNLLNYLEIKILAKKLKIIEILKTNSEIFIKFDNEYIQFEKIMKLIELKKARYSSKDNGIFYKGEILEFLKWYEGDDI
ncbi:MAG: transcription-repair coupling factor [Cetobacterium sp.]|uniref:transcription-repair coupling factor n=5 Tax=Cetobacterium sp. TaxID=2071632 RepID=UPI002FC710E1